MKQQKRNTDIGPRFRLPDNTKTVFCDNEDAALRKLIDYKRCNTVITHTILQPTQGENAGRTMLFMRIPLEEAPFKVPA